MLLRGILSKHENKWYVNIIEEGDWNTQYSINSNHNFWLQIWGEEDMEVCFGIDENGKAILKACGPDTHEYTQD